MKKRTYMNFAIGGGVMGSVLGIYYYSMGAVPQEDFSDVVAADTAGLPDVNFTPK
jgi:hypothetical protein